MNQDRKPPPIAEAFCFWIIDVYLSMKQFEQYQQSILSVLERHSIRRAAVFGSFAKNEVTPDSDIDLLIEADKDFTLFKMLQLEDEITKLTKRKVDLVEYNALKPSIKKEVLQSSVAIL